MTPRFSIIIPVRNGEATILRAVASCLAQDGPPFEVVVAENGSSDATASLVDGLADSRVKLVRCEALGRSHARNVGIEAAQGDYVLFLDADDEFRPGALKLADDLIGENSAVAAHWGTEYVGPAGRRIVLPYQGRDFWEKLHVRNTIPINSMAVPRNACSRFPEGVEHNEDWAFWLDSLEGVHVVTSLEVKAVVHLHGGNTSADVARMKSQELPVFLSHHRTRLSPGLAARRLMLLVMSAVIYADGPPIAAIEESLERHNACRRFVRSLRAVAPMRRALRSLIKRIWAV